MKYVNRSLRKCGHMSTRTRFKKLPEMSRQAMCPDSLKATKQVSRQKVPLLRDNKNFTIKVLYLVSSHDGTD